MIAESRRLAPKTVQRLATMLRSLLRFWHLQGLIAGPLDQVVPRVANRRPGLPRPLEPARPARNQTPGPPLARQTRITPMTLLFRSPGWNLG